MRELRAKSIGTASEGADPSGIIPCICAKTIGSNPVSVPLEAWLPGFVLMEVYPGLRKFAYLIYAFLGVVKMED
jgi:hypothetical protein